MTRKAVPAACVVESLESRQFMSASVPLSQTLGPIPSGHYTLVETSDPTDKAPFALTYNMYFNRRSGDAYGGWLYVHPREYVQGGRTTDGFFHFRIVHKTWSAPMLAKWDKSSQQYDGIWFYASDHKDHPNHKGTMVGTFTLTKVPR